MPVTLILCPVVLGNLGNQTQTVLSLFAMRVLNYNHFETERMTTESWSGHVLPSNSATYRDTRWPLKSRFSNFKVSTHLLLISFSKSAPSAH